MTGFSSIRTFTFPAADALCRVLAQYVQSRNRAVVTERDAGDVVAGFKCQRCVRDGEFRCSGGLSGVSILVCASEAYLA